MAECALQLGQKDRARRFYLKYLRSYARGRYRRYA